MACFMILAFGCRWGCKTLHDFNFIGVDRFFSSWLHSTPIPGICMALSMSLTSIRLSQDSFLIWSVRDPYHIDRIYMMSNWCTSNQVNFYQISLFFQSFLEWYMSIIFSQQNCFDEKMFDRILKHTTDTYTDIQKLFYCYFLVTDTSDLLSLLVTLYLFSGSWRSAKKRIHF